MNRATETTRRVARGLLLRRDDTGTSSGSVVGSDD